MLQRIGNAVLANRQREGWTLEELARRCGVPLEILAALERGTVGITTTQLDRVARALSLEPVALSTGHEVFRPLPSVFLRHQPLQDFDDQDAPLLDDSLDQGQSLADLRKLLGGPEFALQAGVFSDREASADRPDAPAQDGYRLARDVRKWLGNPSEPIGDLRSLVEERFGVAVLVRELISNRVTAVCTRSQTHASIVLNARDPERARNPLLARVYLAHELCHVLFDPSPGGLRIVIDAALDKKSHAAEQRAKAFAAELLLPHTGVGDLLGHPSVAHERGLALDFVARARSRFGTPHPIAANHLCNQGFILAKLREWLEAATTTFAGTVPETTLPLAAEPSRLVTEYVERAHREGLITDGEARAILGADRLAPLPWDEVRV